MIKFFGYTLEDKGYEIVLKNKKSMGFAGGSHFEKDAIGKRQLKKVLTDIFAKNGVSAEDLPEGIKEL